ncbi:FkbM family methyltransferase [Halpernia frigidisoli]|uniref:Methyltransferase, FkbM family n=1 Tax=Halpernia frigidisoli TaxID=1125876 RepID=A0A1I3HY38_9FLAO|nr:FkbM family methyltransferase [Halpernia frigidisoli]SFI40500.1 methyltransferase, FkbM family [Halpernia frigidisoli]
MSLVSKFITRKYLYRFFKHPHLKTLYKGGILKFKDVVNIYDNLITDNTSAKILGSTFYGLEKVNYYTIDEVFTTDFYKFQTETKKPVIIDCGANIGLSVLYFKHTHPDAVIHAFEPDTKNYNYLVQNVKSYGWEKSVFCHKKLVSDANGYEYFEELGNAGSKIVNENLQNEFTSKIEKISLKEFLKNLNEKIDFLKLDIEGSEFEVVPDLKEIFPLIDKMYIEFHCAENDFDKMYEFIKLHIGGQFHFQISTNFTEDQNIYTAMKNQKSKTYYNCFAVNKNF